MRTSLLLRQGTLMVLISIELPTLDEIGLRKQLATCNKRSRSSLQQQGRSFRIWGSYLKIVVRAREKFNICHLWHTREVSRVARSIPWTLFLT